MIELAGATGLEPATFGVTGRRSNQLSYAPAGVLRELNTDHPRVKAAPEKPVSTGKSADLLLRRARWSPSLAAFLEPALKKPTFFGN